MDLRQDLLRIDDLDVDCLIGIHPEERATPQPLRVSLAFRFDSRRAAQEESLAHSVDYARVAGEVTFLLQQGAFQLIETAAEVVSRCVLSGLDHFEELELTLQKPNALGGNGLPSLTIHRTRDHSASVWTFAFGVVDVVWNVRGLGIYRVQLRPGAGVVVPKKSVVFDTQAGRAGALLSPSPKSIVAGDVGRSLLVLSRPPLRLDEFLAA